MSWLFPRGTRRLPPIWVDDVPESVKEGLGGSLLQYMLSRPLEYVGGFNMNDKDLMKQEAKELIEITRKRQLMRLEKEMLVDMVFNLESRNETLVNNLLEVEKMYDKLKGEPKMNKKWYVFVGCAEGERADMVLLSEEEYEVIKRFFENRISFYNEGYSGEYYRSESLGAFESKEDAVNAYMNNHGCSDPDDLVGEFKGMYKEEEDD